MKIAIPSYKRAGKCISQELFKDIAEVYFFVDRPEYELYKKEYPEYKIVAFDGKGITPKRNFILDYFDMGEEIVIVDDDVSFIQKKKLDNLIQLTKQDIVKLIKRGFSLCKDNKTKLWGVYPIDNPFFMKSRINPAGFIIGTFYGVIISELRYDESLPVKEDYDFTLQHILKHKKVIRLDNYTIKAKHYSEGGCDWLRKQGAEQVACEHLLNKYPKMIRLNPKRENEILINLKVKNEK